MAALAPEIVCHCPCTSLAVAAAETRPVSLTAKKGHVIDSEFLSHYCLLATKAGPALSPSATNDEKMANASHTRSDGERSLQVIQETQAEQAWSFAATVTFLGTGSAEPSKQRGSSGILLESGCDDAILLDAGEGIFNQMVRGQSSEKGAGLPFHVLFHHVTPPRSYILQVHLWGTSAAIAKVRQLRLLWISHKHGDHCIGAQTIIGAQENVGHFLFTPSDTMTGIAYT